MNCISHVTLCLCSSLKIDKNTFYISSRLVNYPVLLDHGRHNKDDFKKAATIQKHTSNDTPNFVQQIHLESSKFRKRIVYDRLYQLIALTKKARRIVLLDNEEL